MAMFVGEFTYDIEEYGAVTLEANDELEADELIREHVRESYPDVKNISVDSIKEV